MFGRLVKTLLFTLLMPGKLLCGALYHEYCGHVPRCILRFRRG